MADRHGPAEILLVEDNPGDVRLTREAFEAGRIDTHLHVVTDGQAALDFLYRRGEYEAAPRPDLVLLDLNLPKVDGLEMLDTIKDDPSLKRIPVIILTGSDAEEDIVRSYKEYANVYLTKPVNPDAFTDLIRTFEEFRFEVVSLPPTTE